MATYTAFFGNLRPGIPGTADGIHYYYPVAADVIVLDVNSVPLIPGDQNTPWLAVLILSANDAMTATDTVASCRAKVMANLRPQYPQLRPSDVVKAVWLDSGGLLSL